MIGPAEADLAIRVALASALWLIVFTLASRCLRPLVPRGRTAFPMGVAACSASISALLLWSATGGFRSEHDGIELMLGAVLWATAMITLVIAARLSWQNILELMGMLTLKTKGSLNRKLSGRDEPSEDVSRIGGQDSSGTRSWQGNTLAYCSSCREQRPLVFASPVVMRDGRTATEGKCSICGARMMKIGGGVWPPPPRGSGADGG